MNILARKKRILAGLVAVMALPFGCAKEVSTDTTELSKEFFDAWMSVYHPNIAPTGLGVYIVDDQPGDGALITDEDYYLFVHLTSYDLEGNISSTTEEDLSQKIGSYDAANYYGTDIMINDRDYTPTGVLEMIQGMKVGGTRTAIVPGWLNTTADYETEAEYIKNGGSDNAIYTISIVDSATDITEWEIDTLQRFAATHMDGVDSTKFGFYCKTLIAPDDSAAFSTDTTFYINYTGRLLNGHVFDTTIEDTAKVHGIYSSSKTYAPMLVTMAPDYTDIQLSSDESSSGSTTVDGFAFALSMIRHKEKILCAFYSELGYGYSGSESSIPKYAPLVFEIQSVDYTDSNLQL